MRIKICGITCVDDALLAAELGADALGVIAVPGTPRFVTPETVALIRAALPPFLPLVVVAQTAEQACGYSGDVFQLFDGSLREHSRCIRVVRVRDRASLAAVASAAAEPVSAVLLDAYHEKALGGAGIAFDWSLAVAAKSLLKGKPLILAGGLTPENIAEAIAFVRPYAVDVSSGVEAEPGKKDPQRLRDFIVAARAVK
ncbi:N-(5'-phosphoribosyl)anthranilate isomerase [Armatimonas sp.]|uniref:phosphoribosylanthranilate isomerase n=1 Tax=Armatimonas sp. TaxID=1872638 RepID=UPI00374FE4AE